MTGLTPLIGAIVLVVIGGLFAAIDAAINTVSIAAPLAQIGKPTFGEQDGIQMITVPLRFIPSDAGNDEWSITV